jgi:hypothetical protein
MLRKTLLIGLVLLSALTLALAACGGDDEEEEAAGGGEGAVTVTLAEQNGSGQSGTATLTPVGESQTTVVIELSNPPADPQPAHVHSGTCAELGDVVYPLTNVEGGASETTLDVALTELQSGGLAINAHESEANIQNYIACGEIG